MLRKRMKAAPGYVAGGRNFTWIGRPLPAFRRKDRGDNEIRAGSRATEISKLSDNVDLRQLQVATCAQLSLAKGLELLVTESMRDS